MTVKLTNCKIAFNISKLLSKSISVNMPTQEVPKITDAVASIDQNLSIEQSRFFSQPAVGCERR